MVYQLLGIADRAYAVIYTSFTYEVSVVQSKLEYEDTSCFSQVLVLF